MAHNWNPYLQKFSSFPSDRGTTNTEVGHRDVPHPGEDFIGHGGFSRANISHGASTANTNYCFSSSSGHDSSNWGSQIGNAQRTYREMAWQPDGEQKAYMPRWDNRVSNFGANVMETTEHCSIPPQLGLKQDSVMPKGSQYFENYLNNQRLPGQVSEPRSYEFMTNTSEHNPQSGGTPEYHSQWLQGHTANANMRDDHRYSNMWPNLTAENAIKRVQDTGRSFQPDGISFTNSNTYADSQTGNLDQTSKHETFINICQNANISENYSGIDGQTMISPSETNRGKHDTVTENQAKFNPKKDLFSDSSKQENKKDRGPLQSSSQSSVNDLMNSDASLTDASDASNDSQSSFQASAVTADDENVKETVDCSPSLQLTTAAQVVNHDTFMCPESHTKALTKSVGMQQVTLSTEADTDYSPSISSDPSTLIAGDKDESNTVTESNAACESVCSHATFDSKNNQSDSVDSAATVSDNIDKQTNVKGSLDSVANVSIKQTNESDPVDLAGSVIETCDNKTEEKQSLDSTAEMTIKQIRNDPVAAVAKIDDKNNESGLLASDSAATVTETLHDKTSKSEPLDSDSAANETEFINNKTKSDSPASDSAVNVDETVPKKSNESDHLASELAANMTETIHEKTSESCLLDSDSAVGVTEASDNKMNESDPLDFESTANGTKTIASKTNDSDPVESDSAANVTDTSDNKTNESDPLDCESTANGVKTIDNKTIDSDPVESDSAANVTDTSDSNTNKNDSLDCDSAAHGPKLIDNKPSVSDPLKSAAIVNYIKHNVDHKITGFENVQHCGINIESDSGAKNERDHTIDNKAVVFDSETGEAEENPLNTMQHKKITITSTTPYVRCDDLTDDNNLDNQQIAFSHFCIMDKVPQLLRAPEETLYPKKKIKQEIPESYQISDEIKQDTNLVEVFSCLKSEISEPKPSEEEPVIWDDFGKPLTPSPSELDESLDSSEMKPTEMLKKLQPIVLMKTSELSHIISGKYICAQCMHVTSSIDNLIEHHSLDHPKQPFQLCKSCGVYLVHKDQASQHVCGQESKNVTLSSRIKTKRQKKYCDKCKLRFERWNAYISHMRTHTGITPYKCGTCGLYFAQSSTLNRHTKKAGRCRRLQPFGRRAPKKPHKHSLKSMANCYVKLYDITKNHFCKICGQCFKTAVKVTKHFHNVHKKRLTVSKQPKAKPEITKVKSVYKILKCPLCPMTFNQNKSRNRHIKDCVRENVFGQKNRVSGRYKCPLCLATFTLQSNRYRHLYTFCLRNFLLFLGKNTSKPIKFPRHSKEMQTVLNKLKAEEEELNGISPENATYTKPEPQFKCRVCQAVFPNETAKSRHMKKHKVIEVTGRRFQYRHSTKKSITLSPIIDGDERLKKDTDSLKCKYCEKSFGSSQILKRHEFTHQGERPYYCSQCGKGFKSHVFLAQHKITHQRRIQCTVCKKILPTIGELIQHRTTHPNRGMLQCPDCPRQFTFPVFLVRHLRSHLKTQNKFLQQDQTDSPPPTLISNSVHPCPFCSEVFDNAKLLRKHYLTHIPKSSLKCPFCKRKFTVRRYLLRHIKLHVGTKHLSTKSETKKFAAVCRFCSRTFANNGHLMKHYRGHRRKSLMRCATCNFYYGHSKYFLHKKICKSEATRSTSQSTKQPAVKKVPSAEAKFPCQHCSQTFKYPSLYRRHLLTHKGVEIHACILCGQNFQSLALRSQHEASCDGLYKCEESKTKHMTQMVPRGDVSELKCKFCNKTFGKAVSLRRHILSHNEVKPYRCKACESSFSRYDHLKVHLGRCLGKGKLQLKPQICIPKISLAHVGTGWQKDPKLGKLKQTLECKICVKTFATQNKLRWHNSMFHTVKRFKCMKCSSFFSHEKSLRDHIRHRRCRRAMVIKGKTLSEQTQTTQNLPSEKRNVLLARILPTSSEQETSKTIKCNFCFRIFRTSAHLKVHMLLHCQKSLACDCGKRFFHKTKLHRHIETCVKKRIPSSSNGFSCAYCSSRFLLFSQLQEHFLSSHKLEIKDEPMDTAPLQEHLSNISHFEEHCDASEQPLISKFDFPSEGKKSQVTSELRECPYPCKICNRGFWNKTTLRNHLRKCRRNASRVTQPKEEDVQLRADIDIVLTDSVADNSSEESEEAEPQIHKSSQEKKTPVYQCSECDKSFTDGLLLISHLEAHGREEQEKRLNKCPKCGRTFLNQARLEKHMKIHETVQFSCKDCSSELPSKIDLENHRKQCHDSSAPYSCQICRYRFMTRISLSEHCSKNHPDDIFPCNICNRIYTLRGSLTRHNKKYHEQEQKEGAEKSLSTRSSSEGEAVAEDGNDDDADYNNEDDNSDRDSDSADSDSAPYFPCHVCGKTFTTSECLEDHQRCHLGEKPFECAQCGQCFFQAGQLQQHERKHKSEYQCRVCGRGFVSLFALRKHKHTSGKKRPFRCRKCPLYFTTSALLADHMLSHREESFPCDICNRIFPSKSSRADHRKIHLPKSSATGKPNQPAVKADNKPALLSKPAPLSVPSASEFKYRCGVCCVRFRNPEELSEHGCLASIERQYSCLDCDKHFLHSSHLTKHLLSHKQPSSQNRYPCNQCNKTFFSQDFLTHLRNHEETVNRNNLGFVCPICHQCFKNPADLALHFPNHSSEKFQCKICNKTYLTATQLKEHEVCHSKETKCKKCGQIIQGESHECSRRHIDLMNIVSSFADEDEIDVTGEDQCFCPFCPMQFSSKSNLLEHQNKQHPNEKSYTCEICARTYAKQKYLDRHMNKHHQQGTTESTSQIKFSCSQCRTDFNSAKDLSLHLKLHAAEKEVGEYRCDMCYKSFSQLQLLRRHQESHVGQVVYECTECDKAFAFPHLLEEHQKSHV